MPVPVNLAAAALAACAGAGLVAYAGLSPQSQLFGDTLVAPPGANHLALTFDDGPNPKATPRLLEILGRHKARATFFLIGDYVLREPELARDLVAAGHTVGNHTMHHPWLPRHSNALIHNEIADCNAAIEDIIGVAVTLFRPPHGARRPAVLQIARGLGLKTVQWNLMVGDWKQRSAQDLLSRIEPGILRHRKRGRGTNLVLHDGSQTTPTADRTATVDAVASLLDRLGPETILTTPPSWN